MLGCYFLSVLRKESLEIIIFLKIAVVYFSGTLESPDCFQIEGVPLSVYNWSFMEVRQFK